ncbi:MAG: GNAT family N-acetyltransferase [Chloroflexi bacterium]|nr:GNAT family N-acetyltransferase [Chloroflexota bacterium]MCL5274121.1 GNAT family N-acetyltransferase [Chloroflexota bacterium]
MVAGLSGVSLGAIDPHIRAIDAWHDGPAVADLLEMCFNDEGIDESGLRMIRMLRNYGPLESLIMEGAPGLVWSEDGRLVGNVSIQRNPTRRNTWVIGNVATHPDHRNRGVASALLDATIRFAQARGARHIALQVMEGNAPALRLYQKYGFHELGAVTYYRRPSVRSQPVWRDVSAAAPITIRKAGWSDSASVWRATRFNIPDELTYAEPFDERMYHLGLRWSLSNFLSGGLEQWLVAESGGRFLGAVRTRANLDLHEHHVELMLGVQAGEDFGIALLEYGLKHFEIYTGKPLLATQARPHEPSHTALQAMGFKPLRTLLHMSLDE